MFFFVPHSRRFAIALLLLGLTACQRHPPAAQTMKTITAPPDIAQIQPRLAFTCVHEADKIPPRDPEADQLYRHARWLQKANLLADDPAQYPAIERLLRIASAYGHDKANLELRIMLKNGKAQSPNPIKESVDGVQSLIDRGIPGGYYDMGGYLFDGYGVQADAELALKYYRKAADMGNPEGQYFVGDRLTNKRIYGAEIAAIGWQMYRCAAEQGHGAAGLELGIQLKGEGNYFEALQAFQLGVKAGNSSPAGFLWHGFDGPPETDPLYYLGQIRDEERVRRYKIIESILFDYDYLNPKVPEIDQIVPLPPAPLPPWDGKLQWLEAYKANIPPPLPSEQRIKEMAKAKGLDPTTGRPAAKP